MTKTFFGRHAVVVLMAVAFFVPFGFRGARMALEHMKNDVKDWLPDDFPETKEMEWFWKRFAGERFVLASWDGCAEDDASYKLLLHKLMMPVPPSRVRGESDGGAVAEADRRDDAVTVAETDAVSAEDASVSGNRATAGRPDAELPDPSLRGRSLVRDYDFVGDRLGLFAADTQFPNWGGLGEKWVRGTGDQWYYITPDGDLCQWHSSSPMFDLASTIWRKVSGKSIEGDVVASFGPVDGPWYYDDPTRLNAQVFRTVQTGPDLYGVLTREGGVLADEPHTAKRRLTGLLFGEDGRQTCMVLTLTENGQADLHRVLGTGVLGKPVGRLYRLAADCGISQNDLHIGGPPVDNVAIDEEGTVTLIRLVSISVVLGLGLAFACFRSITATLMVFCVGGVSAMMSMAVVGWAGVGCDAILMSMPSLVYVLGISGAVHLINYYRDAVDEHGHRGAPERALAHGWRPAVFCSVTTALGLVSLNTSQIAPIAKFGLYSAIAVMATLILLFTYLPASLEVFPQKRRPKPAKEDAEPTWYARGITHAWGQMGAFIIRNHYAVAAICVAVIAVVGYGVTSINTSINLLKLFDKNAKILADYDWLESHLGELVPMEVVVRFSPKTLRDEDLDASAEPDDNLQFQLAFLERMEIVNRIQHVIDRHFGAPGADVAGPSVSSATFAPSLPDEYGFTVRRATSRRLEAYRDDFLKSEYLRLDGDGSELWRISLRVGALKDVDYGAFIDNLKEVVEPILAAQRARTRILRELAAKRGSEGFAGASVCLLGASSRYFLDDASATETSASNGAAPDETAERSEKGLVPTVDGDAIFAETLRWMLTASRLRVDYHDPRVDAIPPTFGEIVGQFDAVIDIDRTQTYDARLVQERARLLVDLRDIAVTERSASAATGSAANEDIASIYTGVVPIVYKAQRTLLNSLMQSTFWSFATITPVMMFVSRSFLAGLVAMLPNVLPVFVIFGAMGWLGIDVDIGSMMTASIALGVAVDDTIHFLNWYREELRDSHDRRSAILSAYKRCATPTFQAAVISGLGLSVFALSTFSPTQRFGVLMLTILFAGLVAELVFFPALLAGPLGLVFKPLGRPHAEHAVPLPKDAQPHAPLAVSAGGVTKLRRDPSQSRR